MICPGALSGFSLLNDQVSIYTPGQSSGEHETPTMIIICSWLFAAPTHISKYIQLYQTTIPRANILLIQPVVGDMVWTSDSAQLRQLNPAVSAIDTFLTSNEKSNAHLVLHAFSNAGSHAAVQLAEAYQLAHPSENLPVSALILDSCPGAPSFKPSVNALIHGLPKSLLIKFIGALFIYIGVAIIWLLDFLGLYHNVISKTRRALNSQDGCFLHPGTLRIYLYSQLDVMIPAKAVMEHAEEARQACGGECLVRTVEFQGSGHVRHLAVDRDQYLHAVMSALKD